MFPTFIFQKHMKNYLDSTRETLESRLKSLKFILKTKIIVQHSIGLIKLLRSQDKVKHMVLKGMSITKLFRLAGQMIYQLMTG